MGRAAVIAAWRRRVVLWAAERAGYAQNHRQDRLGVWFVVQVWTIISCGESARPVVRKPGCCGVFVFCAVSTATSTHRVAGSVGQCTFAAGSKPPRLVSDPRRFVLCPGSTVMGPNAGVRSGPALARGRCSPSCPLCGRVDERVVRLSFVGTLFGTRWEGAIARCECGLLLSDPCPERGVLGQFYENAVYYTHSRRSTLRTRARLFRACLAVAPVLRYVAQTIEANTNMRRRALRLAACEFGWDPGLTYLDFGCGDGTTTLALARVLRMRATGVEPDGRARAVAEAAGNRVVEDLTALNEGERFDRVMLSHVLEHVWEPVHVLDRLRRLLSDSGRMLVRVPNADSWQAEAFGSAWIGWDLPRHLWHFTPSTLERAVVAAGFRIARLRTVECRHTAEESERMNAATVTGPWPSPRELERSGRGSEVVAVVESA